MGVSPVRPDSSRRTDCPKVGRQKPRDSKYRLLIPSTEGRNGAVCVFKTHHHLDYKMDGVERMSSVVAADKAAATYLTPFEQRGYTHLDGGIWANNPTMVALVGPLPCFTPQREDIQILSIGCSEKPFGISEGQERNSGMVYWRSIIEVAIQFSPVTAVNQAGTLIGRDRVTILDRPHGTNQGREK